jgi:hypothetical protein
MRHGFYFSMLDILDKARPSWPRIKDEIASRNIRFLDASRWSKRKPANSTIDSMVIHHLNARPNQRIPLTHTDQKPKVPRRILSAAVETVP